MLVKETHETGDLKLYKLTATEQKNKNKKTVSQLNLEIYGV